VHPPPGMRRKHPSRTKLSASASTRGTGLGPCVPQALGGLAAALPTRQLRYPGSALGYQDPNVPRPSATPVPKFAGDYDVWSARFEVWEGVQGFWHLFERLVPRPEDPSPDASAEEKYDQQQLQQQHDYMLMRAFDALLSAVEKTDYSRLLLEFKGRNGQPHRVHDAWMRLRAGYVRDQSATFFSVLKQVTDMRMQENEDIVHYWGRVEQLMERCGQVGFPTSTKLFLGLVLRGLPRSWSTTVTIYQHALDTLTKPGLFSALLEEEERQKADGKGGQQGKGHALNAEGKAKGGKWGGAKQQGQQAKPKRIGVDGAWGELGRAPPGHCHGCHQSGHGWEECPRRPGDAKPKFFKNGSSTLAGSRVAAGQQPSTQRERMSPHQQR